MSEIVDKNGFIFPHLEHTFEPNIPYYYTIYTYETKSVSVCLCVCLSVCFSPFSSQTTGWICTKLGMDLSLDHGDILRLLFWGVQPPCTSDGGKTIFLKIFPWSYGPTGCISCLIWRDSKKPPPKGYINNSKVAKSPRDKNTQKTNHPLQWQKTKSPTWKSLREKITQKTKSPKGQNHLKDNISHFHLWRQNHPPWNHPKKGDTWRHTTGRAWLIA